jgi:hypothetical protein
VQNSFYGKYYSAAELETIFGQVFGSRLTFCGFEPVLRRKWVKDTGRGFKYLFHLNPQHNGFAYLPCGAVSVDFVPKLIAGEFKILTKAKNATVHLSFGEDRIRWNWMIHKDRENFNENVEAIAGESVPQITSWFETFNSIADIVRALGREKSHGQGFGFYSYPLMVLTYAFVLVRVGRIGDATREFEEVIKRRYFDADLYPQLRNFFDEEVRRASS